MTELLGYQIHKHSLEVIHVSVVEIINTINQHSYCMAKRDAAFETAFQAYEILLPDGVCKV